MFVSIFFFLILLTITIRFWWRNTVHGKAAYKLKNYTGPPALPVIGNLPQLFPFKPGYKKYFPWYDKYGSPMRVRFGPMNEVHIFQADHVEALMRSRTNISKTPDYELALDWLGKGLLFSTGELWSQRRKLLTPAFHFQVLQDFVPVFYYQGQKLVKHLNVEVNQHNETAFDICPLISLCTLDILCETAMGIQLNAMENGNSDYVNAVHDITKILQTRMSKPWLWLDFIFYGLSSEGQQAKMSIRALHDFTWKVLKDREAEYIAKSPTQQDDKRAPESEFCTGTRKRKRMAFLDLLLELKEKGEMELQDVKDEVDIFMLAGHDTTATCLMWTCYCMGRNNDVQIKAQQELETIFGDTITTCPEIEQLHQLKYLECCIKESLRLYPPLPIIERMIEEPLKLDEKHAVPVGTVVRVNIAKLHLDPRYFPDPLTYNPDRFLDYTFRNQQPFAFIPFSAGVRNCIGQKFAMLELKMVMALVLTKFSIEAVEPEDTIDPVSCVILRPSKGVMVKLSQR